MSILWLMEVQTGSELNIRHLMDDSGLTAWRTNGSNPGQTEGLSECLPQSRNMRVDQKATIIPTIERLIVARVWLDDAVTDQVYCTVSQMKSSA